eukprot:gene5717-11542_t
MSFRKLAVSSRIVFTRGCLSTSKRLPMVNHTFMSSLVQKQKGEEDAYFRREDEARKSALRAKFEKILGSDDKDLDKLEMLEILSVVKFLTFFEILAHADEKVEPTLISKYGLNDWKIALPIGLLVGIPIISNEVLIINEESLLLACFMLFCGTLYNATASTVSNYCDEVRTKETKLFQAADEFLLRDLTEAVKANQKCLGMETAVTDIYTLTDNLSVAQADLLNSMEQHKLRDAIAKKLGSLVAIEESASAAIRARMVAKVRADVVSTFTNDKKSKENALAQAISVLTAGSSGTLGKDVVGEVFKSALVDYRTAYSKLPAGGDEILVQLEKDVAAVASLPIFDTLDAGNVYVTHPLPGLSKA